MSILNVSFANLCQDAIVSRPESEGPVPVVLATRSHNCCSVGMDEGTGMIACSNNAGLGTRSETGRADAVFREEIPLVSTRDRLSAIFKVLGRG